MMGSGYERRDSGSEPAGTAASAAKIRVYELAKEFGMAPKDMVAKIRTFGVEVGNHMSNLDGADADRVRRAIERERQESLVEERLRDTVIRRRSRTASAGAGRPAQAPTVVPSVPGPAGVGKAELLARLEKSRLGVARAATAIAGHEEDECPLDHPIAGRMLCGEWILFAGVHDLMHLQQLNSLAEADRDLGPALLPVARDVKL